MTYAILLQELVAKKMAREGSYASLHFGAAEMREETKAMHELVVKALDRVIREERL